MRTFSPCRALLSARSLQCLSTRSGERLARKFIVISLYVALGLAARAWLMLTPAVDGGRRAGIKARGQRD